MEPIQALGPGSMRRPYVVLSSEDIPRHLRRVVDAVVVERLINGEAGATVAASLQERIYAARLLAGYGQLSLRRIAERVGIDHHKALRWQSLGWSVRRIVAVSRASRSAGKAVAA